MADVLITTLSTCIVRPSSPTLPQHIFLPATDFMWRWFHYNRRILFFKLHEAPSSSHSFITQLKSSLALALVEFFPWAGRMFEQEDGQVAIDCNDKGVPFIEAYIDLPFSSLENDGFKHQPLFDHFAPHGDVTKWTGPHLPLLSVQVTRFPRDEGFVLGFANCHAVADGSSLWHFMKSWGECAREVALSIHPIHMREALRLEKPPCAQAEKAGSQSNLELQGDQLALMQRVNHFTTEIAQRDFHFTSEMVQKLKRTATMSAPTPGHAPFSSLQVLSAHIWKHMIAATDVDKSKKSVFGVLANMRSRLIPPLPEAYFGNAIVRKEAVAGKQELEEETLGATALRIQELIKTMDDNFMKTFYGKLEAQPSLNTLLEGQDFSMVMLQLSGSHRLPIYDVDFGWGPPLCVRCPRIRWSGEMVWSPGREGGGSIDVCLALAKPVMERLEQDESLLSF